MKSVIEYFAMLPKSGQVNLIFYVNQLKKAEIISYESRDELMNIISEWCQNRFYLFKNEETNEIHFYTNDKTEPVAIINCI